ncbi:MAG TPA: hypothetical protein VK498_15165, partial [Ferruginibacter sp.]|nr:hypothetical protein [Ferruginibacter sp.]
MKNIFLLSILTLLSLISFAQADPSKFASSITIDGLKKDLTIIASDDMEGRETGTEGQRKAAAYIESRFKAIGLKKAKEMDGYQQFYPLYQDSMITSEFEFNDIKGVYGTDYIIPAVSNGSGEFKGKEFVFAGYGIEDKNYNDYQLVDVKDKVVVIFSGEPKLDGKYIVTGTEKFSEWTFPGTSKKLALAA